MISFGEGVFDRQTVSSSPVLIDKVLNDISFTHAGWVRDNTLFRGFTDAGKVKVWINHHIGISNDEIRMGLRNPRLFSSFQHKDIIKIMLDDIDIRDFTVEQFESLVKKRQRRWDAR